MASVQGVDRAVSTNSATLGKDEDLSSLLALMLKSSVDFAMALTDKQGSEAIQSEEERCKNHQIAQKCAEELSKLLAQYKSYEVDDYDKLAKQMGVILDNYKQYTNGQASGDEMIMLESFIDNLKDGVKKAIAKRDGYVQGYLDNAYNEYKSAWASAHKNDWIKDPITYWKNASADDYDTWLGKHPEKIDESKAYAKNRMLTSSETAELNKITNTLRGSLEDISLDSKNSVSSLSMNVREGLKFLETKGKKQDGV